MSNVYITMSRIRFSEKTLPKRRLSQHDVAKLSPISNAFYALNKLFDGSIQLKNQQLTVCERVELILLLKNWIRMHKIQ